MGNTKSQNENTAKELRDIANKTWEITNWEIFYESYLRKELETSASKGNYKLVIYKNHNSAFSGVNYNLLFLYIHHNTKLFETELNKRGLRISSNFYGNRYTIHW